MSDCIHLTGIRAYGYTGYFPEEQTLGQWYEVDLTIWLNTALAGSSDQLGDTYDYSADVSAIQTLIKTARYQLIERLAQAIADIVLASDKVEQVNVRLTKVNPPMPDFMGKVTIDIIRRAPALT